MLEEFIKANNLRAKILPYAAKGSLVKCRLFSVGKEDVLAVYFARETPSFEKLASALGIEKVWPIEPEKAEEISGYKADFTPPISIYGVKLILDEKVASAKKVNCLVSETKTLEIELEEILESNEDYLVAEITR